MILRVHIQNYKSLREVEVRLKPLSVLFGPNAVGKSNFIDALQLLSRLVTSRTLKEAFETPHRGRPLESFTLEPGGIEELLLRESLMFQMEADVLLGDSIAGLVDREIHEQRGSQNGKSHIRHRNLRYRVAIRMIPGSGILQVADEFLAPLDRDGQPLQRPRPFLELSNDQIRLRMEGQAHPTYFDRYLDHTILSRPHYPPHYPHLTALKRELERWFFYYLEPREKMRTSAAVREVRHIGLMGEDLGGFLHTLKGLDPLQFQAVEKALMRLIPGITGIRTEVNRFGEVELNVMEGGIAIPARVVSEGTLRVLGLLALQGAKDPPSVIGFEEPQNGVHPRRIGDIAEILIGRAQSPGRQVLVTTHSPVLPDFVPDESLYVCRRGADGTRIEPFACWGPLGRKDAVDDALTPSSDARPVSERILRGDFDA